MKVVILVFIRNNIFFLAYRNPEYCHLIDSPPPAKMKNEEIVGNCQNKIWKWVVATSLNCDRQSLIVWKIQWTRNMNSESTVYVCPMPFVPPLGKSLYISKLQFPHHWGLDDGSSLMSLLGRSSESIWKALWNHQVPSKWDGL